jgi:hypothetical protein
MKVNISRNEATGEGFFGLAGTARCAAPCGAPPRSSPRDDPALAETFFAMRGVCAGNFAASIFAHPHGFKEIYVGTAGLVFLFHLDEVNR